jgi:N-acetylglucosaminyldiphosphoundecaprenol N-acetyl-beta-D-mannosaminyltransferase
MTLPTWKAHWQSLIAKIRLIHTEAELQGQLTKFTDTRTPHVLAFVNAHAMNSAAESQSFFDALNAADTIYRDGIGMALMYKMRGIAPGLNLNGTDLIPKLITEFNGHPIALYGTEEPFLANAQRTIRQTLAPLSTISTANGFLPAQQYADLADTQSPKLIVLGMGMPKQEQVAVLLRQRLTGTPCLIVCGGAIIDFLGGKVARAPHWMRSSGLEWLYRLALEPKRLFKRYVMGNPKFLNRAVRLKRIRF